jgi:uncharacterized membrane protein (UPF0127 family)
MTRLSASFLLLFGLSLSACAEEQGPLADESTLDLSMAFDTGTVVIATAAGDTIPVTVEIAESEAQRSLGLMERTSLDAESGMVFLFPSEQPPASGFWMYRTLIPLSIAFISGDGRIVSTREMEPCTSPYPQWCPSYESGAPFRSALEVNPGFLQRHGIAVGDRVILRR